MATHSVPPSPSSRQQRSSHPQGIQPKTLALALAVALSSGSMYAAEIPCPVTGTQTTMSSCTGTATDVANIEVTNATITVNANHGVSGTAGTTNITLTGTNVFELTGAADTAILATGASLHPNSTSTITVTTGSILNIKNLSTGSTTERDGLEANANGSGYGEIQHHGSGTIETINGNAAHVRVSGTGYGTIVFDGATPATLKTSGDDHYGLMVKTETGTAKIDSNATVNTTGKNAHGIYALTNGGNIEVINKGNITATGAGSVAIIANTNKDGTSTSGAISVTDMSNKTLTTGAKGIYVNSKEAATIDSNSRISIVDTSSAAQSLYGIDAIASGTTGDATIHYSGPSISVQGGNNTSGSMFAIRATNSSSTINNGNATVNASGNLDVHMTNGTANWLYGIEAMTYGSGTARINYTDGIINVTADGTGGVPTGYGLVSWSGGGIGSGSALLTTSLGTEIHTIGDNIRGIRVTSAQGTAADNDIVKADVNSIITTNGSNAYGVWATAGLDAAIDVSNKGSITTDGSSSHGVLATGGGNIAIENIGTIIATGADSRGIDTTLSSTTSGKLLSITSHADITSTRTAINASATGGAIHIVASGDLTVNRLVTSTTEIQRGISAYATGNDHNDSAYVNYQGGTIQAGGSSNNHFNALYASSKSGDATVIGAGDLSSPNSHIIFARTGGTSGSSYQTNQAGNVSVLFTGDSLTGQGNDASAIWAGAVGKRITGNNNSSNVYVENDHATISTAGNGSAGIHGVSQEGNVTIVNGGNISTQGGVLAGYVKGTNYSDRAAGILAETDTGLINISNTGVISTQGVNSEGIRAVASGTGNSGDVVQIFSHNDITTADAHGIVGYAASGNATIRASHNVTTAQASATTHNHGIEAGVSSNGKASVYFDNGTVKVSGNTTGGGNNIGLVSWDRGTNAASVDGYIYLGSDGIVDATEGVGGMQMRISGTGVIDIDQGAQVHGGSSYGLHFYAQSATASHTLNNAGVIDSMNDRAILSQQAGGTTQIDNYGTITGYVRFANSTVTFNNWSPNSLDLRHFADTDGDGIRDTKAVSVSTFGGLGSSFINQTNGVVRLLPVSGETAVVSTGQFLHNDRTIHDINNPGVVQAQLLELGRFENRGLIDLTAGGGYGDTLVISGASTAGLDGGGMYVSEGGALKVDVVLNKGDEDTQSDLLVVDNVQLGSAPTTIYVNKLGGKGALTLGDGIEVVDVRNTSDADAFVLGNRVVAGPYEYMLYQGNRGYSANSWYLRTSDSNGKPIYRAEVGSYLANQTAATGLFMHTLHDRIGEPQFTETYKSESNVPSGWVRVAGNHTDSSAANGVLDQDTDSYLVYFGGELAQWSSNGNDRWHLGLMGAYGESKTDTSVTYHTPRSITRTSEGKVTGYSVGAYATWYQNQNMPTGLYLDGWLQYGWFDNKVTGKGEPTQSYNSDLFTVSLEAGYAFIAHDGDKRQWMIEPQAQVAYNSYSADDVTDNYGMKVSGNDANGVVTRLGARVYSRSKLGDNAVQPFIEANWWYGSANNSLDFEGVTVKDDMPENRFEAKLGLQGEVAKGWQMWGHIGGMWGENSYNRYEGMIGLKKLF